MITDIIVENRIIIDKIFSNKTFIEIISSFVNDKNFIFVNKFTYGILRIFLKFNFNYSYMKY